jgi:hypothetical protein
MVGFIPVYTFSIAQKPDEALETDAIDLPFVQLLISFNLPLSEVEQQTPPGSLVQKFSGKSSQHFPVARFNPRRTADTGQLRDSGRGSPCTAVQRNPQSDE